MTLLCLRRFAKSNYRSLHYRYRFQKWQWEKNLEKNRIVEIGQKRTAEGTTGRSTPVESVYQAGLRSPSSTPREVVHNLESARATNKASAKSASNDSGYYTLDALDARDYESDLESEDDEDGDRLSSPPSKRTSEEEPGKKGGLIYDGDHIVESDDDSNFDDPFVEMTRYKSKRVGLIRRESIRRESISNSELALQHLWLGSNETSNTRTLRQSKQRRPENRNSPKRHPSAERRHRHLSTSSTMEHLAAWNAASAESLTFAFRGRVPISRPDTKNEPRSSFGQELGSFITNPLHSTMMPPPGKIRTIRTADVKVVSGVIESSDNAVSQIASTSSMNPAGGHITASLGRRASLQAIVHGSAARQSSLLSKTGGTTKFGATASRTSESINKESGATGTVKRDLHEAFEKFDIWLEKRHVQENQRTLVREEKFVKLNELKKFAQNFKLNTEIPTSLLPIRARDEAKQQEGKEKARKLAGETKSTPPRSTASPVENESIQIKGAHKPRSTQNSEDFVELPCVPCGRHDDDSSLSEQSQSVTSSSNHSLSNDSLESYDELSGDDPCDAARVLLEGLMLTFREKYFATLTRLFPQQAQSACQTGSPSSSSSRSSLGQSTSSTATSASSSAPPKNKRKISDRGDESHDDRPPQQKRSDVQPNDNFVEPSRRLACPFFKRRPHIYQSCRSCPGPGWDKVHRLK